MVISDEKLEQAEINYWDHLENVVMKCNHDQDLIFNGFGDCTSYGQAKALYKCSKCNFIIYEYDERRNEFCKKTWMGRGNNPKYEIVTGKDDPRLIPLYGKTTGDYVRELFIDVSKHTWKDLQ